MAPLTPRLRPLHGAGRWLLALAALLLAAYLLTGARAAERVERADRSLEAGRYEQAAQTAATVSGAPAAAAALRLRARALSRRGSVVDALAAFQAAADRTPTDWELRRDWAVLLLSTGNRSGAQRQMNRALELNPMLILPPGFRAR